uniref:Reverse transcriptase domain-containing protein n=1 Tax=Tanacetum cinerariifolium TaxID=118510 RepID=A0A6L2LDQ4_TANCI|nr:hypothetical protein [Tanacetum cinerariifolium]
MSTSRPHVTSRTRIFVSISILSDYEDDDTTLPVVSTPSSPDRVPASSGYSPDSDSNSAPTEDDSSNEDLSETAEGPSLGFCYGQYRYLEVPGGCPRYVIRESSSAQMYMITEVKTLCDNTEITKQRAEDLQDALERSRDEMHAHQVHHRDAEARLQQCEADMLELRAHIKRNEKEEIRSLETRLNNAGSPNGQLVAVSAVPDISGGRPAYHGAATRLTLPFLSFNEEGEDVVVISSDKIEGVGDWNSPKFQDTSKSGQKKKTKAMNEAYDGEINLGVEENMILNEYAVKLCLEHEVKRGNKVVKKELIGRVSIIRSRQWKTLTFFYQDIGTYSSARGHLTQEEAVKEAIAIRMSRKFALLEEERPIIETMAYHDKYKKILDEVWKDKVELDGKIVKEEEEAVKGIKGEVLKEKDDPGAFIFPIRQEGHVNENALADTGSDINTMPYRIYEQLGREDMKNVDRGITMINHTQAEAKGILTNVLCQIGVTTLIAKFLILDILIDRDSPIVVGRGFLCTIGGIVNTLGRLFLTFDGFCHQTFRAARSNVMRNTKSNSYDEEDYQIKRNKFGALIYGPKPALYLNCNDPTERSLAIQTTIGTHDDEAGSSRSKRSRQHETMEEVLLPQVHHEFLLWEGCNRDAKSRMDYNGEIDDMLTIRLREAGSDEEIFTSVAWIRAFNINEPIYVELCHEFYSTYEFVKVCTDDDLQTKKIIKFRLGGLLIV